MRFLGGKKCVECVHRRGEVRWWNAGRRRDGGVKGVVIFGCDEMIYLQCFSVYVVVYRIAKSYKQ